MTEIAAPTDRGLHEAHSAIEATLGVRLLRVDREHLTITHAKFGSAKRIPLA